MALVFETIQTGGIAELSYLVGDDSTCTAAVIDPTPDIGKYLRLARSRKLAITHIFETHIHADLMSGSRELAAAIPGSEIFLSIEGGAEYGFGPMAVRDGDKFAFGETTLTARHTPGHTPEHLSYLLAAKAQPDHPWGVLTGDSLFVGSAGRPDLMGSDQTEELAEKLFHTLRDFYLALPDDVMVFPAHGHGSPCGADIGDRLQSTIGFERRFNPYLRTDDLEEFKKLALENAPPVPTYYPRMKKVNARGPEVLGHLPRLAPLPPGAFRQAVERGDAILVDIRTMLAFGGGHIPGALNIGASPMLTIWAGWLLDPETPILLVLDEDRSVEDALAWFIRAGFVGFAGYLAGGMEAWSKQGLPIEATSQMSVHELRETREELQVIDVRTPEEWNKGHIPGSIHRFLPELSESCAGLDKEKPAVTYCASGYRASIAASILRRHGFRKVSSIPGSWLAWRNAGFETEGGEA